MTPEVNVVARTMSRSGCASLGGFTVRLPFAGPCQLCERWHRAQKRAVPGGLDRADGAEQSQADARDAGQQPGHGHPIERDLAVRDLPNGPPRQPAGQPPAGLALSQQAFDPGESLRLEKRIAGGVKEAVVKMSEPGGAVAEAAVSDPRLVTGPR